MGWREDRDRTKAEDVEALLRQGWGAVCPFIDTVELTPDGSELQRMGVDREITYGDGGVIHAEDKVRWRRYEGDLLLETAHVFDGGRTEPGWIEKELWTGYLGCLWVPSKMFWAGSFPIMQKWWQDVKHNHTYRRISTQKNNNGYTSYSVIVPVEDVPGGRLVSL